MISLIVAMDRNELIGNRKALPWRFPDELRRYREITSGHPLIMGRNTHESIGCSLPERTNIVISRIKGYAGCGDIISTQSLEDALSVAMLSSGSDEVFINGGAEVYRQALEENKVERMYITEVGGEFEGDVFFPKYKKHEWGEISCERGYDINKQDGKEYPLSFLVLEKVK